MANAPTEPAKNVAEPPQKIAGNRFSPGLMLEAIIGLT
jgi:hypothetical protein